MPVSLPDNPAIVAAIKAAIPNPPEWCLFWQWSWELTCMPRNEWAAWVQAVGAIVALYVAIKAPQWLAARERKRIRRGYFAVIGLDLRTGRVLAQTYLRGRVQSPAYRVPLHGLATALPALVADETLDTTQTAALSDWYLDATSFNDCLDLTAELRRDKGAWRGEVSRNMLKAEHLIAGTDPRRPTRYDDAMLVLRQHMTKALRYRIDRHWWRLVGPVVFKRMPKDQVTGQNRSKDLENA
ncbi:hypothetical protein ASC92_12470 [Variovorax sp. Root411]|nr:hypothetical protein ASC92_12470 [Variovorax sp. Root411]